MVPIGATVSRRQTIANYQFGGLAGTPSSWFLGLSTTTPADDGSGFTEPVGAAYARISILNNATNFPAASLVSGVVTKLNGVKFTFPNPTGTWGLITHYGFFTTSTGGLPEWWAPLDTPITPKSGNTPVEFDIAQLTMIFA